MCRSYFLRTLWHIVRIQTEHKILYVIGRLQYLYGCSENHFKKEVIEDYTEKLTVLRYALEQYTNGDDNDIPENVIEAFVEKIVAKRDSFEWYLRFDDDPNDPLRLKTEGKRRKSSTVRAVGDNSPTIHNSTTGSYC